MEVIFANITSLSPKALHWLQYARADAWFAAETHWDPRSAPDGDRTLRSLSTQGPWRVWVGPPQQSYESRGTHGGVAAGVRRALAAVPLADAKPLAVRADAWTAASPFCCGLQISLGPTEVLFFGMYHRHGIDADLLHHVAATTQFGRIPFVAMGDFNALPDELAATGWAELVQAEIVAPPEGTCTSGVSRGPDTGRCIDYIVISKCLLHALVTVQAVWNVPFRPHAALRVLLRRRAQYLREWTYKRPRQLPIADIDWDAVPRDAHEELQREWEEAGEAAQRLAPFRDGPNDWKHEKQLAADLDIAPSLYTDISRQLHEWVSSLECWVLQRAGRSPDDSAHALGRCRPPRRIRVPCADDRRGPVAEWKVPAGINAAGRALATLEGAATRLLARPESSFWLATFADLMDDSTADPVLRHLWQTLPEQGIELRLHGAKAWAATLARGQFGPSLLSAFQKRCASLLRAQMRDTAAADRDTWAKWVETALEKGARRAHQWCAAPQKPWITARPVNNSFSQTAAAEEASAQWQKIWLSNDELVVRDARHALMELRRVALESGDARQRARAITTDEVREVARSFAARTALGADDISFALIAELPSPALADLTELLKRIVLTQCWPLQAIHNWLILLPKKLGGYRTIALMSSVARLLLRMLCKDCRRWDADHAIATDTAAPEKRAELETARRSLTIETAATNGEYVAILLWDLSHFYDGIDTAQTVHDVLQHDFPCGVAALALHAHAGPRSLRIGRSFSQAIAQIGRGVLPGCGSSTSFARLALLDPIAESDVPGTTAHVHVDDVAQITVAPTPQRVRQQASKAGSLFGQAVQRRGLQLSTKSTVVSSSMRLSRQIQQQLQSEGLNIRAAPAGTDLGVGLRPGRRNAAPAVHRLRLGLRRAGRVAILRRSSTRASKLFTTGVRAQACYGATCAGMAPGQRRTLLRAARLAAGPAGFAACPRTTVAIRLKLQPCVDAQMSQFDTWWDLWHTSDGDTRRSITKAWRNTRDLLQRLPRARRWRAVHGPMGAMITILIDAGWAPLQPNLWGTDQPDTIATLDAHEPYARHAIAAALHSTLAKIEWTKASGHFAGRGLEQGSPDFGAIDAARRILRKRAAAEDTEAANAASSPTTAATPPTPSWGTRLAALDAIAMGGASVGTRFSPARPCSRCGAADESHLHRYFKCPANNCPRLRAYEAAVARTDWADPTAPNCLWKNWDVFWARAVVPGDLGSNLGQRTGDDVLIAGSIAVAAKASRTIYTDGAGGPKWAISSLRRVGAGGAAIDLQFAADGTATVLSAGLLFASVPGHQTVPRAETWAGSCTLKAVDTHVSRWHCDATYTVTGTRGDNRRQRLQGPNGDTWGALFLAMDKAHIDQATKVKSHCTLTDVREGRLCFADYLGNGLADIAAGHASEIYQEQGFLLSHAENHFGLAVLLALRLSAIEATVWTHEQHVRVPRPQLPETPAPAPPREIQARAKEQVAELQHKLVATARGSFRCTRCQRMKRREQAHDWRKTPCLATPTPPAPAATPPPPAPPPPSTPCTSANSPHAAVAPADTVDGQILEALRTLAAEAEPWLVHAGEQDPSASSPSAHEAAPRSPPHSFGLDAPMFDDELDDPPSEQDYDEGAHAAAMAATFGIDNDNDDHGDNGNHDQGVEDRLGATEPSTERAEPMVSARAARRILQTWRTADRKRRRVDAAAVKEAVSQAIVALAQQPSTAWDVNRLPEWVQLADPSHDLRFVAGILFCGRCGSAAARQVRCSLLARACSKHTPRGGTLQRLECLLQGRLPTAWFSCWPDGSTGHTATCRRVTRSDAHESEDSRADASRAYPSTSSASADAPPQAHDRLHALRQRVRMRESLRDASGA